MYLSLCAVLLSEATNLTLSPFVEPATPALTRARLTWVRHNYIRTETIVKANARLVAMQDTIPVAHTWGGSEVAVADGLRFVVPVRSAHAAASRRYFGRQREITWYHGCLVTKSPKPTFWEHLAISGTKALFSMGINDIWVARTRANWGGG